MRRLEVETEQTAEALPTSNRSLGSTILFAGREQ